MRANRKWKQILRDYEEPGLGDDIDEALIEFVATCKESMPDIWH